MARALDRRYDILIAAVAALTLLASSSKARAGEPAPDAPPPYPPAPATGTTPPVTAPQVEAQPAPPAHPPPPASPAPVARPYAGPPPGAYPPPARPWIPPPATPRSAAQLPTEPLLTATQLALGTLTTIAVVATLAAVSQSSGEDDVGSLVFFAMPAATGFVVCALGSRSQYYRGGCTSAVVGAYIGLLSAIPLAFVGCQLDGDQEGQGCLQGALLGIVAGILVGPAAGATIGWHLFKDPRTEDWTASAPRDTGNDRASLPAAWVRGDDHLTGRRPRHSATPARLSVPLLSLQF